MQPTHWKITFLIYIINKVLLSKIYKEHVYKKKATFEKIEQTTEEIFHKRRYTNI